MCTINKVHFLKKKKWCISWFYRYYGIQDPNEHLLAAWDQRKMECKSMALLRKGKFIRYSNFTRGGLLVKFE